MHFLFCSALSVVLLSCSINQYCFYLFGLFDCMKILLNKGAFSCVCILYNELGGVTFGG